ncbi:MAG TPA: sigma-E factor regulatory protein RseB domain-containing protein [Mycobacteriales bacterium]|nr:sigma-E factor regulatory protein RseB domain-containing protein [Mycobacteriales bacterium]
MSRQRLAVLLVGLGLLLTAAPGAAAPSRASEEDAVRLLEEAARASRTLTYTGTKYVAAWRSSGSSTSLVDVRHDPRRGLRLSVSPTAASGDDAAAEDALVLAATTLDRGLLRALSRAYDLRVAGPGRCTGRDADVVEARRPGDPRAVAGRFWLDRETGLLLRREVYDDAGQRLRSSAFVDLETSGGSPVVALGSDRPVGGNGEEVGDRDLDRLRDEGWPLPEELPGGFVLFDARRTGGQDGVLHLAFSDGLSTTSLFVQEGELGSAPPEGFVRGTVAEQPVWVHDGAPERLVWAGADRVWTLVSDAPEPAVTAAVAALPHADLPDDGLRARLARGLSRLGSWLNPFS